MDSAASRRSTRSFWLSGALLNAVPSPSPTEHVVHQTSEANLATCRSSRRGRSQPSPRSAQRDGSPTAPPPRLNQNVSTSHPATQVLEAISARVVGANSYSARRDGDPRANMPEFPPISSGLWLPGTVSGRSFSRATNQTTENGDFQEKEDGSDGTRTRDLRRDRPAL
jgi:hypothetical protein